MQKEKKKKYSKPEVKKISFDAKTSVLASCCNGQVKTDTGLSSIS